MGMMKRKSAGLAPALLRGGRVRCGVRRVMCEVRRAYKGTKNLGKPLCASAALRFQPETASIGLVCLCSAGKDLPPNANATPNPQPLTSPPLTAPASRLPPTRSR